MDHNLNIMRCKTTFNFKDHFLFDCTCEACENDWPTYSNLPQDRPSQKVWCATKPKGMVCDQAKRYGLRLSQKVWCATKPKGMMCDQAKRYGVRPSKKVCCAAKYTVYIRYNVFTITQSGTLVKCHK